MTWLLALLRVAFQVHAINEGQIQEIARSLQSEYPDWKDEKASQKYLKFPISPIPQCGG
jgi:hypothetical protein